MSVMDKLKRMLKGHEEQADKAADKARGYVDEATGGRPGGQVDKGPDALRDQMRSPQERDNPPQP
jgi:antitoxin protein of toxin-antitoxin system